MNVSEDLNAAWQDVWNVLKPDKSWLTDTAIATAKALWSFLLIQVVQSILVNQYHHPRLCRLSRQSRRRQCRVPTIDHGRETALPCPELVMTNNYGICQILIVRSGLPLTKILPCLLIAIELTN